MQFVKSFHRLIPRKHEMNVEIIVDIEETVECITKATHRDKQWSPWRSSQIYDCQNTLRSSLKQSAACTADRLKKIPQWTENDFGRILILSRMAGIKFATPLFIKKYCTFIPTRNSWVAYIFILMFPNSVM